MNQCSLAIIGSGARENALEWKLSKDYPNNTIYTIPGNGGSKNPVNISSTDFETIKTFCINKSIKLIVVGPEVPLSMGIVDYFANTDIKVFGPSKEASILESSKVFSKNFMIRNNVATSKFQLFDNKLAATEHVKSLKGDAVIKYDGLAQGKGVYVTQNIKEAFEALDEIFTKYENPKIIIEERLVGREMSIIGLCDGLTIKLLPTAQDYKRIFDNDLGPNTGGMGAFSHTPFCSETLLNKITQTIINPTLAGLQKEKIKFRGFIYFGIMNTKDGPKLLEYNARLGDPETSVILPKLKSNLTDLILSTFNGTLSNQNIEFNPETFTTLVYASNGYPNEYKTDFNLFIKEPLDNNTLLFHAGTKKEEGEIKTTGGRVLNLVTSGNTLEDAKTNLYKEAQKVGFENAYFRKDIGSIKKKKLAILVSGNGSNMETLVKSSKLKDLCNIELVIANTKEAKGLSKATALGIRTCLIESKNISKIHFENLLLETLASFQIDYVILAGFMKILTKNFISRYPNKIINIHPADTQKYQGAHGYEWAFENKLKETHITVHYVDEGVDTGLVIAKNKVDIAECKTLEEIKAKGLRVEHEFYSEVLQNLLIKDF